MSSVDMNGGRNLSRDIGLFGAVSTVVADTFGAKLFATLSATSSTTGPGVILVVVLSGLPAMSIALDYGWMATTFPSTAGSHAYVLQTFDSRLLGFVMTWPKWLSYMTADAAVQFFG